MLANLAPKGGTLGTTLGERDPTFAPDFVLIEFCIVRSICLTWVCTVLKYSLWSALLGSGKLLLCSLFRFSTLRSTGVIDEVYF